MEWRDTYEKYCFDWNACCRKKYGGCCSCKRLGYEFVDTDLLIQKQEKRLLKEIIAQEGNDGFLAIENQVNRDLDVEMR